MYVITTPESVKADYVTNEWHAHLNQWDGDEHVNFAVRCNNGVWYFPIRHVTGNPSPRFLGWI